MNSNWFELLGFVGCPLLLCSILALAIILERSCFFIYNACYSKKHYEKLASQLCNEQNKAWRDEIVSITLSEMQVPFYKHIKMLKLIASIAPMLGLLGTVLGLITAFRTVASITTPVSPNIIAAGLWEALLTTAYGLVIAIPCLFFAHMFKMFGEKQLGQYCMRLNRLSLELGDVSTQHTEKPVSSQRCPRHNINKTAA